MRLQQWRGVHRLAGAKGDFGCLLAGAVEERNECERVVYGRSGEVSGQVPERTENLFGKVERRKIKIYE